MKWLLPALVFVAALLGWQAAVTHFGLPAYLVPPPADVLAAARTHAQEIAQSTMVTGGAALAGFAISVALGVAIAAVFAEFPLMARSFYPYAIFLQTVPLVAIAPLIVLWAGPGLPSIVIVTVLVSVFPIITSTVAGLTDVEAELFDLFAVYEASRWRTFRSLRLPNAVPHVVAGAQAAGGLAVVGAIAGEVFAGAGASVHGLGYLIVLTAGQLKTAYLFAAVLASTALGVVVFVSLALIGYGLTMRSRGER